MPRRHHQTSDRNSPHPENQRPKVSKRAARSRANQRNPGGTKGSYLGVRIATHPAPPGAPPFNWSGQLGWYESSWFVKRFTQFLRRILWRSHACGTWVFGRPQQAGVCFPVDCMNQWILHCPLRRASGKRVTSSSSGISWTLPGKRAAGLSFPLGADHPRTDAGKAMRQR